ncbi:MAG: aspartate ammonia-lyase [Candidatus Scalindua sp. AMX11]|nr:MAG: aspartate ammonia-lyase [Candidatus Scalindua sp.]NOG84460.1 aspartate ammonia-lyase [Planctomycetota bacterium]RZV80528.1 MAG: aspartate ammonia-lyase [Candidatus Scalindua sp. SCAELEC01]TDE65254.1 MAG: aspartate ammonia-lyase [Candidatus Scalindua sp. AMX11]GJQ58459.1 MAG: aspartate ammonia-lyase [Candidatus Scalindua sp.]
MKTINNQFRIERDTLGEAQVPIDCYYGVQTVRALENFPISGIRPHPKFTKSMVYIKKAAAKVNNELGCLSKERSEMIIQAADRILKGEFQDQFVVDVYQAGAGTSCNMNVNEVIANIAIEGLGGSKGDYSLVHPNDHVNCGQSTNDVFPTAMRIAALLVLKELIPIMDEFVDVLDRKAEEFNTVIKSGRTHLQDAAPIRLGQEFSGYADSVSKSAERIENASASLHELGIGGTAVGTGINTHPEYARRIIRELQELTKIPVRGAANRFEAMQSSASIAELSSSLKVFVVELIRIANDLRIMSSGPRTGLSEINLPAVQPGSSIMPAKVNPVMAEMLNMVCFSVIGNDLAITMAAQAGQLELNVMMPLMQYKLLDSISIIANALKAFINKCASGITANRERCYQYAINSFALVTALNPYIGYSNAADVANESRLTGKPIKEIVLKRGLMSKKKLEQILSLESMTQPGLPK